MQLRTIIEIGSREAIREAVIRGIGIGYVSEAEFIPDARLRAERIRDAEIFTAAHVVLLRERAHSRIIKAFLDVVRGTLQRSLGTSMLGRSGSSHSRLSKSRSSSPRN